MRALVEKVRPTEGFAKLLHFGLQVALPALIFVLVRLQFVQLAFSLVVLSKWRMFAVKPRFWPAILRSNSVDLMVGFSIVFFMVHSASNAYLQLFWALLYVVWLVAIKPATSLAYTSVQAFIGQFCALMALYVAWSTGPLAGLTVVTGAICYFAARHFFDSYDEPYAKLLSYIWAYFGAGLAWVLGHWLLFYRFIAQPTLLLSTIGYSLAVLYYLDHHGRLGKGLQRQFIFVMLALVFVIVAFSNWGNKVV